MCFVRPTIYAPSETLFCGVWHLIPRTAFELLHSEIERSIRPAKGVATSMAQGGLRASPVGWLCALCRARPSAVARAFAATASLARPPRLEAFVASDCVCVPMCHP